MKIGTAIEYPIGPDQIVTLEEAWAPMIDDSPYDGNFCLWCPQDFLDIHRDEFGSHAQYWLYNLVSDLVEKHDNVHVIRFYFDPNGPVS